MTYILVSYKNKGNTYNFLRFKTYLPKRIARFAIYKFVRKKLGNSVCKSLCNFEFDSFLIATGLEFSKEDLFERWEDFEYLL